MKVESIVWHPRHGWSGDLAVAAGRTSLGLVVADLPAEVVDRALADLRDRWNPTVAIGCSTAGQSVGGVVHDASIVATLVQFDRCNLIAASVEIDHAGGARRSGRKLAEALAGAADVRGALLLADCREGGGRAVNGTLLASGIDDVLPGLALAGALAGDNHGFRSTWIIPDGRGVAPVEGWATIVGLEGDVEIGFGSGCGWEAFGPERLVTRSYGDVLYELDGAASLALYRDYLGPWAAELPGAARRFPLCLRDLDGATSVRTVVDIDEATQSLRFAGDVPQGAVAQLMCAPADSLVHHAQLAAKQASFGDEAFAIAISGAGRRLALGERIEDELDAVLSGLAPDVALIGLQSCGELSSLDGTCELRNETVTVMTFGEGASA